MRENLSSKSTLIGVLLGFSTSACADDPKGSDDEVGATDTGDTGDTDGDSLCLDSLAVDPAGADWQPSEAPGGVPVAIDFDVSLDPAHPDLDPAAEPKRIDPRPDPVTITGGDPAFSLTILAKRPAERPETIWLEVYVLSEGEQGLAGAELELAGLDGFSIWDLSRDPWSDPVAEPRFVVGSVAPGATGRALIGVEVPADAGPLAFTISLSGIESQARARSSAPLAISPNGAEVWSPFADADVLAVVDTASDTRVAQLDIPGRPSATAITPDGEWVLSTASACNQLVVIDRASRAIVQVFGEAEGIGRDPEHVLVSPDGRRAFVSSYVGDSVTVLRRVDAGFRVEKTIALDRRPVGMAIDPASSHLYVAHWMPRGPVVDNEAWVSVIDLASLALVDEIVSEDDSNLDRTDCIGMIFAGQPAENLTFEGSFSQFSGVFVDPSGGRGAIPSVRLAPFPILEGDPQASGIDTAVTGANSPLHLIELDLREPEAAQWSPLDLDLEITDRSAAFLECVHAPNVNEFVTPFIDPETPGIWTYPGKTSPAAAAPINTTGPSRFMTWSPDGREAFILGTAADHLIVLDGATLAGTHSQPMTLSGENPIGMVFTPDGRKAYVAYENSTSLGVLDTSAYADAPREPGYAPVWFQPGAGGGNGGLLTFALMTVDVNELPTLPAITELGSIALVDSDPMDSKLRRGRILFNSSNPDKYPELASSPQATCQACHPHGGTDGAGWPTVEGERRTIGLWGGTGGRGWLHYSGTHASAEEFATIIVEERLGGTGLSPADVDALASYTAWGIPEVQRPVVDETLAAAGKVLFETHCQGCHSGDKFGSGAPEAEHPYGGAAIDSLPGVFDVGTATDNAHIMIGPAFTALFATPTKNLFEAMRGDRSLGADDEVQQVLGYTARPERMRGFFKAPSLVNVWENPCYFHDGRFAELREVVDYFDTWLALGLEQADRDALVEYLKTL